MVNVNRMYESLVNPGFVGYADMGRQVCPSSHLI